MKRRTFLKVAIVSTSILPASATSFSSMKPTERKLSSYVDLSLLLECLSQVESNNRDNVRGRAGERSKYQISEIVWRQHRGRKPFFLCRGAEADRVAMEHLVWLTERPFTTTPYLLALMWKIGYRAFCESRWTEYDLDYAIRVSNLYHASRS